MFNEVLSQTIAMLRQHGRVSYRALKRQFALDDDFLEDLKAELVEIQQRAIDQDGTMLVWTGDTGATAAPMPASSPATAVPPPQPSDRPRNRSLTRRRIWPRRFSRPAVPWKGNASKSLCSLLISKALWSCWPTGIPRKPGSSSIPFWNA
jgi:hypothetical protein